ncbi:MAG: translation initiation factor IF-2 [Thermodesulfobacteriota bacterium]
MVEKEEQKKEGAKIVEKRIKSTVIRRRAAKAAPKPKKEPPAEAGEAAAAKAAPAAAPAAGTAAAPEATAAPAAPVTPAAPAAAEAPAEKPAAGKAAAGAKPAEKPSAKKPPSRKEVKVFGKERKPEPRKFFTPRRPSKKGRRGQPKGAMRGQRMGRTQLQPTRELKKTEVTVPKAAKRVIRIVDAISVGDLSQKLGVKASEIIRKLMGLDIMATVNQLIEIDAATVVAQEYGYEVESAAVAEEALITGEAGEAAEDLTPRAPVVTVMGHVDHGKTSLLDAIRKTSVATGEAGGITQHIGAYHVQLKKGNITFLDTPGHEAFTAMRARGAQATDIVVLVVAANDGVMPQTVEAINHARAAGVPIIVAINKVDLPEADLERVRSELSGHGLVSEQWGGDSIFVEVSAKKGTGIKELLEMILLQSEMLELKASSGAPAHGVIVEAKLEKGRGPVATVLIKSGTIRVGDVFVTGVHYGRIRAMISDWGARLDEAGPSMPVEIIGLSGVPDAGDAFDVVKDESTARQIASMRQEKTLHQGRAVTAKVSLDDLFDRISKGEAKELNVILKGDVHGSIEAVTDSLEKLSTEDVKINVLHSGVGGISEGDVMLASASNAIVIGFNVRPEPKAGALAEQENVDLRLYNIIYDLTGDIRSAMEGMLEPIIREEVLGRADVREVFKVTKVGTVAGCYVTEGKATRNARVRLIRDNIVVYEGVLSSLKRFKDDVKEVATGYECGMAIEGYNDIKVGDVLELYTLREEAAKL